MEVLMVIGYPGVPWLTRAEVGTTSR